MVRIATLSFLFILISLSITAQDSKLLLRGKMMTALAEEKLTGAVWSTVDSGGHISADAYGIKSYESKRLLAFSDRVQVGSVTKTLLATGILRLVTIHKINLDSPVEKILPGIHFENPWASTNPVTVRHLLNHTSGLEDLRLWQMFSKKVSPNTPLSETFSRDPSVLRIYNQPGSVFSYSNMGYTMLAMVIEAVTRQRYEDYLDTYLLEPLGMTRSTFNFVTQLGKNGDKDLAMGHLDQMQRQEAVPMYLRPAGQFTTTAYDMGIFIRFLLSDGRLHRFPFIREDLLKSMGSPAASNAIEHGLQSGYSLGLMKRDYNQVTGLAHAGNTIGYHAMLYLFPEEKKGFFVAHNMDSETADYEVFNKILIQSLALQKKPVSSPTVTAMPADMSNWKGNYIPVRNKFKAFAYLDLLTGFLTLLPQKNELVLSQFQKNDKLLVPTGHHLFKSSDKLQSSIVFYSDKQGNPLFTTGFKTYIKISSIYLWTIWMSFILGVLGLLYLFFGGWIQIFKQGVTFLKQARAAPFLSMLCLLLPLPFFLTQSFVALGDVTPASIITAIVTALLPIALLIGIGAHFKNKDRYKASGIDLLALLFALQLVVALAYWRLIPLLLWV